MRLTSNCLMILNSSLRSIATSSYILNESTYWWNITLRGFLEGNDPKRVVMHYAEMRRRGVTVDSYSLMFLIKACSLIIPGISIGRQVHAQLMKSGFESELFTQTAILSMYGFLGDLESAERAFDETPQRDIVQWNALIATYAQINQPMKTIVVVRDMIAEGVKPSEVTVVSIINACSQMKALLEGKEMHAYVMKNLAGFDIFVQNALIHMYTVCGYLLSAHHVFEHMRCRNMVSWTSLINGYSINGFFHKALDLFREMRSEGEKPDEVTVLGVISVCAKSGSSELGKWIHGYAEKTRYNQNLRVANALIDMHSKCGNLEISCNIFDKMSVRTLITWTSMIQGLASHGHAVAALLRFSHMQMEGFKPDEVVFLNVINTCHHSGLLDEGKQVFQTMVEEYGMVPWIEHYGSMVNLLCRGGSINEAMEFVMNMPMKPDTVIWRTLIGAFRDQGSIDLARKVLDCTLELEPEYSGNYILKSNLHAMTGEWNNVQETRNCMELKEMIKAVPGLVMLM